MRLSLSSAMHAACALFDLVLSASPRSPSDGGSGWRSGVEENEETERLDFTDHMCLRSWRRSGDGISALWHDDATHDSAMLRIGAGSSAEGYRPADTDTSFHVTGRRMTQNVFDVLGRSPVLCLPRGTRGRHTIFGIRAAYPSAPIGSGFGRSSIA